MSALDRAGLLGKGRRRIEKVLLSGGAWAFVRSLFERERTEIEAKASNEKGKVSGSFRRRILVKAICDEAGQRIFADEEEEVIGEMDAADASLLFDKAWDIAGFNGVEVAELEKNSDAGPSAGSS